MRGLYRGYSVTAFCTPLNNCIYFPIYESFKDFYRESLDLQEGSFSLYGLSAVCSGVITNIIMNPCWMVRTRMQAEVFRSMNEKNYKAKYPLNLFKTINIVRKKEGIRTLYNGLSASMIGVSHPLIYFPLYEKSKIYFKKNWDSDNPDPNKLSSRYVAISTIWCKAATSFMTYPHEVLRARMQDTRKYETKNDLK